MQVESATSPLPAVETGLVRAHAFFALLMVIVSAVMGLAVALKFNWPDFLSDQSFLTWGRLRYNHTQGIFFGWLGNAFLAFLYYAVPRLAERQVTSRQLGWSLFFIWNFLLVIPGWILVQAGFSQPLEWAEFPLVTDAVVVVAFGLLVIQFAGPFFRGRLADLYVSGWYILGALVFTTLAYPIGNFVPELIPGARGATYSGLWIHDSIGLWVTPLALAVAYFVIPAATGKPIYSHFLSMIGFWLLFFIYPLNGTHHYIFSSIPMGAQKGAIVASVYLGMNVILVVANLLMSLRGSAGTVVKNVPLRFVWTGILFYLVVSLQGSLQALMPVNQWVHFTDWVIAHAHLALIGFASFVAIGGLLHAWQNLAGCRYHERAANGAFWLLLAGLLLMFTGLTAGGLVQAQLWASSAPWMESVNASQIFWWTRTLSGLPILAGFVALVWSILRGPVLPAAQIVSSGPAVGEPGNPGAGSSAPIRTEQGRLAWLENAYVLTGVAGIGFFAFSFVVLAVWPNQELGLSMAKTKPVFVPELTPSQVRGSQIYAREGCAYCHSLLVRFTAEDVRRFGMPTAAWETNQAYPQMWGTRRIGPDLSRETGKRSFDWQLAHLYDPQSVVPESVMPRFPWLFSGSATRPTQEALDVVAYLQWLGSPAKLAGRDRLSKGGNVHWPNAATAEVVYTEPGPPPLLVADPQWATAGCQLFMRHCSGCHGADGMGKGPAAASLLPQPKNLTVRQYSDRALSTYLWQGVEGSSMPAWHELPLVELRSLVAYIRAIASPEAKATPETISNPDERDEALRLYTKNCALCHGASGAGDGPSAGALAPKPTNFQQERPATAYAMQVVRSGVPGSSMPPWQHQLSDHQRKLLVRLIRNFYQPQVNPKP